MDYQVLIVSRLDFGIRNALEHAGGIAPGNITEVKSVAGAFLSEGAFAHLSIDARLNF